MYGIFRYSTSDGGVNGLFILWYDYTLAHFRKKGEGENLEWVRGPSFKYSEDTDTLIVPEELC